MKMLLLAIGLLVGNSLYAMASLDTVPTPSVIQLAKVSKGDSKFWILYHTPSDLLSLEKEGYQVLKTKVKMVRNNQFWLDLWQSSLRMAAGYIIAKSSTSESTLGAFYLHFLYRNKL